MLKILLVKEIVGIIEICFRTWPRYVCYDFDGDSLIDYLFLYNAS